MACEDTPHVGVGLMLVVVLVLEGREVDKVVDSVDDDPLLLLLMLLGLREVDVVKLLLGVGLEVV